MWYLNSELFLYIGIQVNRLVCHCPTLKGHRFSVSGRLFRDYCYNPGHVATLVLPESIRETLETTVGQILDLLTAEACDSCAYCFLLPQPEELTLLLIKLRRQQAELNSIREQTLAQLMQLNVDTANPKVSPGRSSMKECWFCCCCC